jgi:hypothetical protein
MRHEPLLAEPRVERDCYSVSTPERSIIPGYSYQVEKSGKNRGEIGEKAARPLGFWLKYLKVT